MLDLINKIINEIKYSGVLRKQKTITKLFPEFPARVKRIGPMGGLKLHDVKPDLWHFKVHSGTKDDVWYDNYVKFVDIEDVLDRTVRDMRLWNKTKTRVLLPKLAKKVLFDTQVQVKCSCLTGDTLIPLLDGRTRTMVELLEEYGRDKEFWVFASDDKGDFVPAKARCAGQTGSVDSYIEVGLDNGRTVCCTSDHLFRMRNGKYKQAGQLRVDDSLMPWYVQAQESTGEQTYSCCGAECEGYTFNHDYIHNHKVVNIRRIYVDKEIPVYDLTVEKYHNFAVDAGVYVHNCPAFQYWGPAYILSLQKYGGKYTEPEVRPPRVRNPRQYGAVCKHMQNVLNVLPWYVGTMAKYLKDFYIKEIERIEKEVLSKRKRKE